MGGSSKKVTVGYRYYVGMHVIAAHGPVDQVTRISFDDRIAWRGRKASGRINLRADNLFGGESREGGVSGAVDFEPGSPSQGRNDYLQAKLGALIPAFRGVAGFIFRQCYFGINPYLKKVAFRLQRIHQRKGGLPQWYGSKAQIGALWELPQAIYISLDVSGSMGEVMANGQTRLANVQSALSDVLDYVDELRADTGHRLDIMGVAWANGRLTSTYRNATSGNIESLKTWFNDRSAGGGTDFREGVADAASFFDGAPADALRTVLFITDGVPGIGSGDPSAEQITSQAAATLFAVEDVWSYAFNIDLTDTTYTAQLDNTPGDAVPVMSGSDPGAMLDALKVALGGQADMNPAHIIRECLTDPDWGMGYQESDVDDTAFVAAANTLYAEGMGMSLLWDRQVPLEDFVKEVVKHIDGALYVDRATGKFVLTLIRDDYVEDDLLSLGEDDVERVEGYSRPAFGELVNSVTVNHWDHQTGKTASITVDDPALVQMQGAVIGTTIQYPGFTNGGIAARVAQRDLRALSTPLLSCTIYAKRKAAQLNIGRPFKFEWPDYHDGHIVMRVTGMALGDGRSNKIRLTCTQDVFSLPDASVVTPTVPEWEDPNVTPEPATVRMVTEAPYYELVQQLGQTEVDAQAASNPDAGYVLAALARPMAGAVSARLYVDSGAGYEGFGSVDFSPAATLAADIGPLDLVAEITGGVDLDLLRIGSLAHIGGEIVRIDAVADTQLTIGRGCLDTMPANHSAGTLIVCYDDFAETDGTEYVAGEGVDVKLATITGIGELALDTAPVDSMTFASRAIRPYPPAQVKINNIFFPAEQNSPLSITWATRNRQQQTAGTVLDWYADSVTSESGVTYDAELRRADNEAVLASAADVAGVSTSLEASYNGMVDLVLRAKRDGYYAWQDFVHRFQLGAIITAIIPELRSGVASFTSSSVTSFAVAMPSGVVSGDYLIMLVAVPINSFPSGPAGWDSIGSVLGATNSDSTSTDSYYRAFGRVADGTEGSTQTCTIGTATTWGAVVIAIKKDTYTPPRGQVATWSGLAGYASGGVGHARSFFSSTEIKHSDHFAPYWGGEKSLSLSLLGRKQSNDDPPSNPFTDFAFQVNSNLTSVPDALICGKYEDAAPAAPYAVANYAKNNSNSNGTFIVSIRGVFPATRPECVLMQAASSGGSTVTSLALGTPSGLVAPIVGDLQILVLTMFGSSGVTITPPAGFSLVTKFGNRLAVYKRVTNGGETYPDTITFSSAISVMAHLYTLPINTYDSAAEVLTATASGASGSSVSTPSRTADSSWAGKQNYALRFIARNGAGGTLSNTVSAFPAGTKEQRRAAYNQGSTTERVSFACAGGIVDGEVAPAESFTFLGGSYAWEAITIFIKGI